MLLLLELLLLLLLLLVNFFGLMDNSLQNLLVRGIEHFCHVLVELRLLLLKFW